MNVSELRLTAGCAVGTRGFRGRPPLPTKKETGAPYPLEAWPYAVTHNIPNLIVRHSLQFTG